MTDPILTTPRLYLRTLTAGDAPDLLALYAHDDVMRYWSHGPWTTLAEAHAAIGDAGRDDAAHLAIVTRAEGKLAGSCALFDLQRQHRRATLGYLLAPQFWGQGLAAEALRALVDHGIGALGLQRIEAEVDPRNAASLALLARLGFRREGVLRARWCVAGVARDVELWAFTNVCGPGPDSL